MKCSNCGRERSESAGSVLKLSEDEQAHIAKLTGAPSPIELFYCKPCYRIVTDREMGARLISGQIEVRLRLAGHPRAQQIAESFYRLLIEKSTSKQVS